MKHMSAIGLMMALSLPAAAQSETAWVEHTGARTRLVSAVPAVDRDPLVLGWEIELEDGWKVYWRSPGEAGRPPVLRLADPASGTLNMRFPLPSRFQIFGLQTFGYADRLVLPLIIDTDGEGEAFQARVLADFMICSDICVPHETAYELDLPAAQLSPLPTQHADAITASLARVPKGPEANVGLNVEQVTVAGPIGRQRLTLVLQGKQSLEQADAFIEAGPDMRFDAPRRHLSGDGRTATLVFEQKTGDEDLVGTEITITLTDGRGAALEMPVVPGPWLPPSAGR